MRLLQPIPDQISGNQNEKGRKVYANHRRHHHHRWHFGVPDDGRLIAGGMLPYVIEWQTDHHPASNMADEGCRFKSIEIHHPLPFWIKSVLESIDASELVKVHALPKNEVPHLIATIDTSSGERKLHSNDSLFNNSLKMAGLWPTP